MRRMFAALSGRGPESTSGLGNRGSQGEALTVWGLWAVVLGAILVTYTRLEPSRLYRVTGDGLDGALSRVLVEINYPLALVAVAFIFIALDVLPSRWMWLGGIGIALCAVVAWPGVVDDADLDARLVNVLPALGVGVAFGLTLTAATHRGRGLTTRKPFDTIRVALGAVIVVLSLPWIAADLGLFLPDGLFITERPIVGSNGSVRAAVHLGQHHGFDGALLALSALILSRSNFESRRLGTVATPYIALMFAYGSVNFAQDFWNEQLVKRGSVDWAIPSALEPTLSPVWLAILAITAATTLLLRDEASRARY